MAHFQSFVYLLGNTLWLVPTFAVGVWLQNAVPETVHAENMHDDVYQSRTQQPLFWLCI